MTIGQLALANDFAHGYGRGAIAQQLLVPHGTHPKHDVGTLSWLNAEQQLGQNMQSTTIYSLNP